MLEPQTAEQQLVQQISTFYDDPLGHVLFSYPWGQGQLQGRRKEAVRVMTNRVYNSEQEYHGNP